MDYLISIQHNHAVNLSFKNTIYPVDFQVLC